MMTGNLFWRGLRRRVDSIQREQRRARQEDLGPRTTSPQHLRPYPLSLAKPPLPDRYRERLDCPIPPCSRESPQSHTRKPHGVTSYSWQPYALDLYSRQGYGLGPLLDQFSASGKQKTSGKLSGNIMLYFRQNFT